MRAHLSNDTRDALARTFLKVYEMHDFLVLYGSHKGILRNAGSNMLCTACTTAKEKLEDLIDSSSDCVKYLLSNLAQWNQVPAFILVGVLTLKCFLLQVARLSLSTTLRGPIPSHT